MKILPINLFEVEPWLLQKHYAKRMPSISYCFGAYDGIDLIGVVTYGSSASTTLRTGICGERWQNYVIELNRLVCDSRPNLASMLIGRSLQMLPKPMVVVSYADTEQGHVGYVYQACNFLYTGLSAPFRDPRVMGLEAQHHASYAYGMTNAEVIEHYGAENVYFVDRARKHRYVFFCGDKKQRKQMLKDLNYPIEPYPKGDSRRYDAGGAVKTQLLLFG